MSTLKESGSFTECPPLIAPKQEKVICEVCGHANPEFTSICTMCSNYLKGMNT